MRNELQHTLLGEIAFIEMGQSPSGHSYNSIGKGVALINGPTEFTTTTPIAIKWTIEPTKICQSGDLLICVRGSSVGRINIADKPYCIGRGVAAIRAKERNVDQYFLIELIRYEVEKVVRLSSGSTFPNIDKATLADCKIILPTLSEQRKIAAILRTWDEAIEKTDSLINIKRQCKRHLMNVLFCPYEHNERSKFVTGDFSASPRDYKGWEQVLMGEIFKRVARKNTEENKNVVTISAQRGFVAQGDYFNKIVASETLTNYFLIHKGEFAYNKSYSNGYPMGAIKKLNNFDKAVVTTLYICFSLKSERKHSGNYFEYFFDWGGLNKELIKVANEGGRDHGLLNVKPDDFFGLALLVPDYSTQCNIAIILNTADNEIRVLQKQKSLLQSQKRGLMQKLLTGAWRVQVEDNLPNVMKMVLPKRRTA